MSREECRGCGAKLRHDKTSDQYDPEYCSGKCRKEDGSEPYVRSAKEKALVVQATTKKRPASLEDYKKNVPSKYARRFEPEKLNWSKNEMNDEELKQAGFRANRKPIPGDWDYREVESLPPGEGLTPTIQDQKDLDDAAGSGFVCQDDSITSPTEKEPNEWQSLKARAKELDISVYGKKKEQLVAEIKEKQNA